MIILKCLFLIVAIAYTFGNVGRVIYHKSISAGQMWIMAISVVGFIYLQVWA